MRTATLLTTLMTLGAVTALAQGVGLTDGGIQFPDGTVQETSAVVPDGPAAVTVDPGDVTGTSSCTQCPKP